MVEELGITNETQIADVMKLEEGFAKNFYFGTEQLCQLQDDEWDTLKEFIPTSLVNPMYNMLKR